MGWAQGLYLEGANFQFRSFSGQPQAHASGDVRAANCSTNVMFIIIIIIIIRIFIIYLLQQGMFNWNPQTQGLVLGSFYYGYAATQIISGIATLKIGGKLLILVGLLWMSLLTLLTPIVTTVGGFGALFFIRLLEGMGQVTYRHIITV